jgi:transcriptional regulator with XRE-family HTH domain
MSNNTKVTAWEMELSKRVGVAVNAARTARGLSARQLADRTKELGYPIARATISTIENNLEGKRITVAAVMVLALALGVAPVQLLYPELPDGPVRLWPNAPTEHASITAALWFSGETSAAELPGTSGLLPPQDLGRIGLARYLQQLRWQIRHMTRIALTTSTSDPGRTGASTEQAQHRIDAAAAELCELVDQMRGNRWPVNDDEGQR